METISLNKVRPADYNPRKLSPDAFDKLKESINELGVIKPILVNADNNVIIAGHQRTRAMLELGITEAPCFMLRGLKGGDEMRFNQIHNACEYEIDPSSPKVHIVGELELGYNRINPSQVIIDDRGKKAYQLNILCSQLMRFGDFAAPIVGEGDRVIVSSAYALACKLCNKPLFVYKIDRGLDDKVISYFSNTYGVFSYEHLEKHTYIQGYAQLYRGGGTKPGKDLHSRLYKCFVWPYLDTVGKSVRILDFGAGMYREAEALKRKGYDIVYVDPYHPKGGRGTIAKTENIAAYRLIQREISEKGLFDVVKCDSVLNSVDSVEAERSVVLSVASLCKSGGTVFFSGREKKMADFYQNSGKQNDTKMKTMYYLDENGFTAQFRNGEWFYQRFHDKEETDAIADIIGVKVKEKRDGCMWQLQLKKTQAIPQEESIKALRFEWDLPLPDGTRYGLSDEIEQAYKKAVGLK